MSKPLCELLQGLQYTHLKGDPEAPISGLAYDSRKVRPGALFACLSGLQTDGHMYISKAVESGAAAVMLQAGKEALLPAQVPAAFAVTDTRVALAKISAEFYARPCEYLNLVGVTGTNGKSTTVHLIDLLHRAAGFSSGVIGTLACRLGEESRPAERTTPEAPDLQALLAEMREKEISHVAMEVSSHALAQYRADGCHFHLAVFTNLSRDHLDYHVNEEDYFAAKLRLFADPGFLPARGERVNIVNADDPAGERIASAALGEVITYGIDATAKVRASQLHLSAEGSEFHLETPWGKAQISTPLLGRFNVYNALAAISVALTQQIPLDTVVSVLQKSEAPTGRFQRLPSDKCSVVIDYAHTPDGLGKVLTTAKDFCRGRLFVVFGCGGDRDQGKRPVMGELASRLADVCVITSDNPRSEDPQAIISQILSGISPEHKEKCLVEPDRALAIRAAISRAGKDDLVLVAGKGHETYQIFADRTLHFDDREAAQEALKEKF